MAYAASGVAATESPVHNAAKDGGGCPAAEGAIILQPRYHRRLLIRGCLREKYREENRCSHTLWRGAGRSFGADPSRLCAFQHWDIGCGTRSVQKV